MFESFVLVSFTCYEDNWPAESVHTRKISHKLVHSFEAEIAKSSDFKGEFHGQINWLCNSGDHQGFRGNLWNLWISIWFDCSCEFLSFNPDAINVLGYSFEFASKINNRLTFMVSWLHKIAISLYNNFYLFILF